MEYKLLITKDAKNDINEIISYIVNVQWVQSLEENISELKRFDDEQLFPYLKALFEELERVNNPSPMIES